MQTHHCARVGACKRDKNLAVNDLRVKPHRHQRKKDPLGKTQRGMAGRPMPRNHMTTNKRTVKEALGSLSQVSAQDIMHHIQPAK